MEFTKFRKEHLFEVSEVIVNNSSSENSYNRLISLLNEEMKNEGEIQNYKENQYLNNLRQTLEKQVTEYNEAKKTDKFKKFQNFAGSFLDDVREELRRLEYATLDH